MECDRIFKGYYLDINERKTVTNNRTKPSQITENRNNSCLNKREELKNHQFVGKKVVSLPPFCLDFCIFNIFRSKKIA